LVEVGPFMASNERRPARQPVLNPEKDIGQAIGVDLPDHEIPQRMLLALAILRVRQLEELGGLDAWNVEQVMDVLNRNTRSRSRRLDRRWDCSPP